MDSLLDDREEKTGSESPAQMKNQKPKSAAGRVSSDIDFRGGAKMRDKQSGRAATVACFTVRDTVWALSLRWRE